MTTNKLNKTKLDGKCPVLYKSSYKNVNQISILQYVNLKSHAK